MISPDDLEIPVDPEGMKSPGGPGGPGSPKCPGFLGNIRGLRGLGFLEDLGGPEDPGGMSMKFRKFLIFKDQQPVL